MSKTLKDTGITWTLIKKKVKDLIPADYNPRILSDKARADLTDSLVKFGQAEPVVINSNGTLIGGHQRVTVLADIGIEECDAMVPNRKLSKAEERELNLRLNKNTGDWDWAKLKEFFQVDELKAVGFQDEELSKFFDEQTDVDEDDFDADAEAAKITKPETQLGDIWQLGDHRLICGDSTLPETVTRLMDGKLADMCWTDPPYNVNYNHRAKYGPIRKQRKREYAGGASVINDHMSNEAFLEFLAATYKNIYDFTKDSAGVYICHAMGTRDAFFSTFIAAGFHYSQTIIWMKERIILSLGQDYHRIYEPIMYGWKKGHKRWSNRGAQTVSEIWNLDKVSFEEQLDLWYLHRDKSKDYEHPTQKPVRLPERAIKKSCPIGGIVFEPFCGSGSALLACEQLKRKCYAVEMDPRYCDVIVKRWEKHTSLTAERL